MKTRSVRGNGNRAVWREVTVVDGRLYRLPNGELVQASVVPHPDALPVYWEEAPIRATRRTGGDETPAAHGLTLSVVWPEGMEEAGSVGPAYVRLVNAPGLAGVPWAGGYDVSEADWRPEVWRNDPAVGVRHRTGWTVRDLAEAGPEAEREFREAMVRAVAATMRLVEDGGARAVGMWGGGRTRG